MRISVIVDNFFGVGGTETNTRFLVDYLHKSGHKVYVVTTWKRLNRMNAKIYGIEFESTQDIYTKKNGYFSKILAQLMTTSLMFILTLVVALKERIEIIHAHMALPTGFLAVVAGAILRKPVVVSVRGSDLNIFAQKLVYGGLTKFTLSRAEAIIALSQGLKKAASKLGISLNKIFVIPNGVDTSFFGVSGEKHCGSELNIEKDKKIVLFVGTIESYRKRIKGLEYLLFAMKNVIGRVPTAQLIAVGVPPLPDLLKVVSKLRIENHVLFLGVVPYTKIPCYYDASDVFVLPSLMEGLPTTVLEAMASAKPVVASDIEGCRDLIEDGVNGFLVPVGQTGVLADKIVEIITNDELAGRLGKEGRRIAEAQYTWEIVTKKTSTIYRSVLRQHEVDAARFGFSS